MNSKDPATVTIGKSEVSQSKAIQLARLSNCTASVEVEEDGAQAHMFKMDALNLTSKKSFTTAHFNSTNNFH